MYDAIKVIVYDARGDVLVLRRSQTHPTLAYHPDLPGGCVDAGETWVQAAIRELAEETGICVPEHSVTHEYTTHNKYGAARVIYSTTVVDTRPEITISWEHDKYDWLSKEQFATLPKPETPDGFLFLTQDYVGGVLTA